MDQILSGLQCKPLLIYLNDVIVKSAEFGHLWQVFDQLHAAGL